MLRLRNLACTYCVAALLLSASSRIAIASCFPQGVRDPVLPIAYVETLNGVEALRLADGSVFWTYEVAGRPIAVLGAELLIQIGEGQQAFRILVVNKISGTLIVRSEAAPFFPTAAIRANYPTPSVSAVPIAEGVLLQWRIQPRYTGGANPPRGIGSPQAESAMSAEMDLKTGKVTMRAGGALKQDGEASASKREQSESNPDFVQYVRCGEPLGVTWAVDGKLISLHQGTDSKSFYLEVQVKIGAKPVWRTLIVTSSANIPRYVTDNGEYLLVSGSEGYWTVYSSIDGSSLGKFAATSIAEPCVVGMRVYYRTEELSSPASVAGKKRVLIAQDLETGQIAWSRTLVLEQPAARPKLPQ